MAESEKRDSWAMHMKVGATSDPIGEGGHPGSRPTVGDILEQLSFWESVRHDRAIAMTPEALQMSANAAVAAALLTQEQDALIGAPLNPEPLTGFMDMRERLLQSVQRFESLIHGCAPYLAVAEEELTDEYGDNPFMMYGINGFFAVLESYLQLFHPGQNVPEALSDKERARFIAFLRQFLQDAERLPAGISVLESRDMVAAILDAMVRDNRLGALLDEREKQAFIQNSQRTLTPITRSPKAYMPVSKVARKQLLAGRQPLSVDVGGGALVHSEIHLVDGIDFDEFDIEIQNTIGEMIQHNKGMSLSATPAQIFRECAALMEKEKVGPEMEAMVICSIDKMLQTRALIDCTGQIQRHKNIRRQSDFDYSNVRIEGHLIEGRKMTVNAGGHLKVAYRFYDLPMYYAYSHAIGQIAAVNKKMLNTSKAEDARKSRKNTRDFVVLKRALAREVERIKREKQTRKGIYEARLSYRKIQEEVGLTNASEKQLRTLRDDVDYLCDHWVRLKHIKGCEKYKLGRAFAGIRIEV